MLSALLTPKMRLPADGMPTAGQPRLNALSNFWQQDEGSIRLKGMNSGTQELSERSMAVAASEDGSNEALRRELKDLNKHDSFLVARYFRLSACPVDSFGTVLCSETQNQWNSRPTKAPVLQEIAEMRLALMEAYQELVKWQQESANSAS
eukprot:Skav206500  [mRNA]  locus=scaffold1128:211451:214725:+ [translate_table: standard]